MPSNIADSPLLRKRAASPEAMEWKLGPLGLLALRVEGMLGEHAPQPLLPVFGFVGFVLGGKGVGFVLGGRGVAGGRGARGGRHGRERRAGRGAAGVAAWLGWWRSLGWVPGRRSLHALPT